MHWIVVPHRLPPFHDQGDLLRITGILSIVSARCPFCWSSHPSLYIPILFLNVLRSLLVRIIDTPRGFTELRIPSLFSHIDLCSQIFHRFFGALLICLGCIELLNWVGASIFPAPSGYLAALLPPFLIIPWVISPTSIQSFSSTPFMTMSGIITDCSRLGASCRTGETCSPGSIRISWKCFPYAARSMRFPSLSGVA